MIWSSDGNAKRRRSLLAALSALAAAAGLALASSSAGQVPNTWSGTWVNSAPDGSFWVFSQSGSGQSVGGVWKGNASSGTLSGTIAGSTLNGTLVNNEASLSASFSITLAPDGHSFSGTFTVSGGSPASWRSACSGGACLSNTAPPAPPPVVPPGGGAPAAQTSPKLLAAAAWGPVGPAIALAPGGEVIVTSPPIGAGQREASVTVSGDTTGQTTVTTGAPTNPGTDKPLKRGDCVRAAVGLYNKSLSFGQLYSDNAEALESLRGDALISSVAFLIACLDYVKELDKQAHRASLTPAPRAARASCRLRASPLSVQHDRVTGKISWSTRRASRRGPAQLLRGSCRQARNGTVTLRIRTASRRVKLRKVLGPHLVVGAYRSASASGTANVQATFKRR